jgi:uncharacterized protein (TIGR03000 family)
VIAAPAHGTPVITTPAAPAVQPEQLPAPKGKTDKEAKLIIEVPAQAKLYIDNQLMKATDSTRVFNTPQLQPNTMYYYDLRAEVVRDGQTVAETKRVTLKAGDTVRASFELAQPAAVASR